MSEETTRSEDSTVPVRSGWKSLLRWILFAFVVAGALLFPVFLLGIRVHVHPFVLDEGVEVFVTDGLHVRHEPLLGPQARSELVVSGRNLLTFPVEPSVVADWGKAVEPGGGWWLVLQDPNDEQSWKVGFDFAVTQDGNLAAADATMHILSNTADDLTGTLLLNTLDWSAPGPKTGVFALHSDWGTGRCLTGAFTLSEE